MSHDRSIFSYTAPGADVPEFLSINVRDGELFVTVRPAGGDAAEMRLPREKIKELVFKLQGARPLDLRGSSRVASTSAVPSEDRG